MTRTVCLVTFAALLVWLTGCYTQIARTSGTGAGPRKGPRPDLAIVDISGERRLQHFSDAPSVPETHFRVRVVNLGPADFEGSVGFNCADNRQDIQRDVLPYLEGLTRFKLQAGDSIEVAVVLGGPYPPMTPFRFLLRTDEYPLHTFEARYFFGREPIPEVSLENNVADVVLE